VSVFTGALSLVLAITEALGKVGWIFLLGGVAVSLISCGIYYFSWYLPEYLRHREFFGLSDGALNLVISSYRIREGSDPNTLEFQKEDLVNWAKPQYVEGPRGSEANLTGLQTAKVAFNSAVALARSTSWNLRVVGDKEQDKLTTGPILCLGSSTSNNVTKDILPNIPQSHKIEFTPDSLTYGTPPTSVTYKSNAEIDYGVINCSHPV
jgi:hypothetical protein